MMGSFINIRIGKGFEFVVNDQKIRKGFFLRSPMRPVLRESHTCACSPGGLMK